MPPYWVMVASGKVTPEEAEPVSVMLGAHLKTIETVDIDRRLRELVPHEGQHGAVSVGTHACRTPSHVPMI
jgi:hypothetical protein